MAGWVCADCTTTYSVGAPRCPHCRSARYVEEGTQMPKVTVHGGATDASAPESAGAVTEPPASTAPAPAQGGASSPGTSFSTSSAKAEPSSEPSESEASSPARKTASRSRKARTGSSSAPGTDGGPAADTSDQEATG